MNNKFNDITYYGTLIAPSEADNIEERDGYYPLSTNNLQGEKAKQFISKLSSIKGLKILLDYDAKTERADTVIIYDIINSMKFNNPCDLLEIICSTKPDECNKYGNDTIRLWWN